MDQIKIYGLKCFAYHGVYEEEQKNGQTFVIQATLYQDVTKAGKTDSIYDSTHYGEVCQFMDRFMKENRRNLLEAVACEMAEAVLLEFPLLQGIDLEIQKPEAPIPLPFDTVGVSIHRSWKRVYLSVGSNLGDSRTLIEEAIRKLKKHRLIRDVRVSELLVTKPYGGVEQPDFLNGAIELWTMQSPEELLDTLHGIEKEAGRERLVHWGPRTLDLDILFYDKLVYESDDLIIPHVDLENRYFVLKPMSELNPNFRHPLSGKTITQSLAAVSDTEEESAHTDR